MKIKTLSLFILISIVPLVCHAAYMGKFTDDFETYDVDEWIDNPTSGLDWNRLYGCTWCYSAVKSDVPARYGDKYESLYCTVPPGECNIASSLTCNETLSSIQGACENFTEAYRITGVFRGFQDATNSLQMNWGNEYWFAWSMYIPEGYVGEGGFSHIFQFKSSPDSALGNPFAYISCFSDSNTFHTGFKNLGASFDIPGLTWFDKRGTWVDMVVHIIPTYVGQGNPNGVMDFYVNGVKYVVRESATGLFTSSLNDGYDIEDTYIYFTPHIYNTWIAGTPPTPFDQCTADLGFTREQNYDYFVITEQVAGYYDYCDVCAPIWAAAPTINYPTDDATGVSVSTTALTYSVYADHRTDLQSCFSRDHTQVQVQETGGDWTNLIFETLTGGTASTTLSNLSSATTYDVRVRHYSLRYDTSDTYAGEWSSVITFTTEGGELSNLYPTSKQACGSNPQTVEIGFHSERAVYCRWDTSPLATEYTDMSSDNQFTGGEGDFDHTADISQACDGSTPIYAICNDQSDGSGIDTERVVIVVDVDAELPPEPTVSPVKIVYRATGIKIGYHPNSSSIGYSPSGGEEPPSSPAEVIIDNGDTGTSYTGTWSLSGATGSYQTQSVYSIGIGATYTFETSTPIGTYKVYEWHTVYVGTRYRNPSAAHAIYDGAVLEDTVNVNQQSNGGQWNLLGTYTFDTSGKVVITSPNNTYTTCADAIKFEKQ
jgi:hypothetical protein